MDRLSSSPPNLHTVRPLASSLFGTSTNTTASRFAENVKGVSNVPRNLELPDTAIRLTKDDLPFGSKIRFIEKFPQNGKPLTLTLNEDKEHPPECERHAMNFSLITEQNEDVAAGRCSIYKKSDSSDYMHISAIYVEGNVNNPTKIYRNKYVGLGQLLVFAAIKFGFEQNVATTLLTPLHGSKGFYLKMGFYPKVTGNPNRMVDGCDSPMSYKEKLNPEWLNQFNQSSFLHKDFRGSTWAGSTSLIYSKLKENILRSWEIG